MRKTVILLLALMSMALLTCPANAETKQPKVVRSYHNRNLERVTYYTYNDAQDMVEMREYKVFMGFEVLHQQTVKTYDAEGNCTSMKEQVRDLNDISANLWGVREENDEYLSLQGDCQQLEKEVAKRQKKPDADENPWLEDMQEELTSKKAQLQAMEPKLVAALESYAGEWSTKEYTYFERPSKGATYRRTILLEGNDSTVMTFGEDCAPLTTDVYDRTTGKLLEQSTTQYTADSLEYTTTTRSYRSGEEEVYKTLCRLDTAKLPIYEETDSTKFVVSVRYKNGQPYKTRQQLYEKRNNRWKKVGRYTAYYEGENERYVHACYLESVWNPFYGHLKKFDENGNPTKAHFTYWIACLIPISYGEAYEYEY